MKRQFRVAAMATLALAVTTPASAQWGRNDSRASYGYTYSEVRRIAYDRGFQEGTKQGERDGRRREPFHYQDERAFQRADAGYHRSYGDIERYRVSFRSGFADGYTEAYRRYARGVPGGGYGRGGGYEGRGYGGYGPPARYVTPFDIGARDGYEKGLEDGRGNRAFDARRHRWYREGDREYDRRFGDRERYKAEYRRGFVAGYEQGYREARYR
ncbi:MAG TPA: hypothetical protein VM364_16430 [Vicinamibacterales bacterium]|nr:hypothetical protein [Vicinamibacterales bacterium]